MAIPQILDHLVFEVPDLEAGVAWFAEQTGVTPVFGGRHEGRGTANYLVRLHPQGWAGADDPDPDHTSRPLTYLEILGRDPEQDIPEGTPLPLEMHTVTEPVLRTWAVRPAEASGAAGAAAAEGGLNAVARIAAEADVEVGDIHDMSRRDPEGTLLEWRLSMRDELPHGGLQPFLIDWLSTAHPALGDLPVATLESFEVLSPEPEELGAVLDVLGASDTEVAQDDAGLRAVVSGPGGSATL